MPGAFSYPHARDRLWRLDVLRAVAVVLVIGHHSGFTGAGLPTPVAVLFGAWNRAGWVGVDLFFVLSGFLVSGLLFREWRTGGQVRPGRFLIRRGFKIYPSFYVYLAITAGWYAWQGAPAGLRTIASEALFVQNYGPRLLVHTWSLAVEEHFYLLLALAFALAPGALARRRVCLGVFAAVATATMAGRIVTAAVSPAAEPMRYYTHLRIDSLLAGVVVAYAARFEPGALEWLRRRRTIAIATVAVLVAPATVVSGDHVFMRTVGVALLWIAFAAVVALAVAPAPARPPHAAEAAAAIVGRHSYSVYLWHLPLRLWLPWPAPESAGPLSGLVWFVAYAAVSILGGIAMSKVIEIPALQLRERLFP